MKMSQRSFAHKRILDFLTVNQDIFTEKHGIIVSNSVNHITGGIIARKITFGIKDALSATVWVWSHDSIEIRASGKFYAITGSYKTAEGVILAIHNAVISPTKNAE